MVIKMIILCIFMLFDVLTIASGRSVEGGKDADVLIVGGGISGLAAAGRLEKAGLKVIAESKLENALHEHMKINFRDGRNNEVKIASGEVCDIYRYTD